MRIATCLLCCLVVGCTGIGSRPPQRYFVLGTEPASTSPDETVIAPDAALLLSPTTASAFYDTQGIVFSTTPGTRSYYQLNHWTEPPSRRIDVLLTERLARTGRFRTVAASTDAVKGALVLSVRLDELYHDASTPPGNVRISLMAVLADPAQRVVAEQRRFISSMPAATYDAPGAVDAFNTALGPLLDDVAKWVADATDRTRAPIAAR
jgi:cholesterol transport system auxiliary component